MDKLNNCSLEAPDLLRRNQMKQECVSQWMTNMSNAEPCVRYFSGVASGGCSAASLQDACKKASQLFTIQDAETLCTGIQSAHQDFWPSFWIRQSNNA